MNRMAVMCGVLFVISLPFASTAQEEREKEEVTLPEVVVTATRYEEEIRRIPASVTVITEEDIRNSNAQTIVEILKAQPGILVRDFLGNGKTATVDMRGFGETAPSNTLVLVDGRRVNEITLAGVDWSQIPLDRVERIEIIRGMGSVLYGDNAVGGVINIITKKGRGRPSLEVGAIYGSYEFNSQRAGLSGSQKGVSYSIRASHQGTKGYRENSELQAFDVGGKLGYEGLENFSLGLDFGYHKDCYGLPGPLSESQLDAGISRREALTPEDHASTETYYASVSMGILTEEWGELHWDFSFRKRRPSEHYEGLSFGVPFTFDSRRDTDTIGLTPRYILDKTIWGRRNKFITGLDYYFTDLELDSDYFSPGYQTMDSVNFKRRSWGVYANDEFSILKNLILTAGFRYEGCQYKFDSTNITLGTVTTMRDELSEEQNAYHGGLTFLYGERSSIFARYTRSFRYPLADEYFVFYPPPGTINRALRVQTGDSYEIGIRHYFTPDIDVGLTYFLMNLKNEIYFNPLTYANENYDKTRHQGIELSFHATVFEGIALDGNYTYTHAKFRGGPFDGNDIPAVPRHKGSIGVSVTLIPNVTLSVSGNYVGETYFISDQGNQYQKLDDYTTVDARLSYTWKGLTAFIGASNLLNKKYSQYGVIYAGERYYYPSPEITIVGGFSYIF